MYINHGLNTVSEEFGVTRSRFARDIGRRDKGYLGSKVMEEMKISTLTEPTKPAIQSTVSGVEDMGDTGYIMETQIYIIDMKECKIKTNAWEDLNTKIYNLCLQNCPPVLESVLKANIIWENISCKQNGIGLLLVIRDITHKQDENI